MQNPISLSADNAVGLAQNVVTFNSAEFGNVRAVVINGEPWFVGKDVAEALGYAKARNAIAAHVDEDDALKQGVIDSFGREQETTIINESGLYSLILGSKLESAKKFKHWVTSEVLPAIRKTGSYTITQTKVVDPVREKEIGLARAEFLRSMAQEYNGKSEAYKQILDAYATKELEGQFILPLPEATQKSYSAGEVGKMLGISANKVGLIANKNGLKTDKFGHWVHDKSPYSSKEVESFRYYDNAVTEIKKAIDENGKESK